MDCLQAPFIRMKEAVLWTQRFLKRKFGPKIEVYFESKYLQKFYISSKIK